MILLQRAEDIGEEIVARLEAVTVANGAETDLGRKVYRGVRKVDDSMLPCCVVVEGEDTPERQDSITHVSLTQRYVLLAYVPCDPLQPNAAAHAAIRDLKRAIFTTGGKPDSWMGRKVGRVRYRGRDIGPREDGLAFVVALIEIEIDYVENLAAP